MTDRPIIFSAPMVRALLEGRKTQTRRILKPQFPDAVSHVGYSCFTPQGSISGRDNSGDEWFRKLLYAPGDRLYVREGHYLTDDGESEYAVFAADQDTVDEHLANMQTTMASHPSIDWSKHLRLRPSIHMPRWASRLTLTVTDVRVQRLQEISESDAKAEGLATVTKDGNLWKWGIADSDGLPGNDDHGWHWREWEADPRAAFKRLWNSLHGPDAWDANPWVVAVSFDTHRCNIDQMEATL